MINKKIKFKHIFNDFVVYVDDFGVVSMGVGNRFCCSWEIKKDIASTKLVRKDLWIMTSDGVELILDCTRQSMFVCKSHENKRSSNSVADKFPVDKKLEILKSIFEKVAPLGLDKLAIDQIMKCSKEVGLRSDEDSIVDAYQTYLNKWKDQ